jgi:hypothetical protein
MSDIDIDEIIDDFGEIRRLGSLAPEEGFVSAFQTFEKEHPVWDDADILKVAKNTDRKPRRLLFGKRFLTNQKSVGSCNGWAGANAYAKRRFLSGLMDWKQFSGSFLYSLINGGRDNGSILERGMAELQRTGVCEIALNAWNQIFTNQVSAAARENAKRHKGIACYAVQTFQGFRTALAADFAVIVAVQAGRNFQRLNSQGIAGVDNGGGNHAVHCDDIRFVGGEEVYDHEGSWGESYGTEGRSYLPKESFADTFNRHVFYAVGAVADMD